ncbi:MAG: hypothetical protein AB7V42_17240 [Thermoleophilia bacterium]
MPTFPIRRSKWALPFLLPLSWRRPEARVLDDRVEIRMGWIGSGDVPLSAVAGAGRMHWPWWGGVGARIARGMVAFVGASGETAVLELSEPVSVRAPFGWTASRIGVGVEDVEGFLAAVAAARVDRAGPSSPA